MASVINSARTSTATVFELVGNMASAASQLVTTGTRAIDALDAKARVMHSSVIMDSKAQIHLSRSTIITSRATEHTDLMEEAHRRNFPNKPFDREAFYLKAVADLTAIVDE